MTIYTPEQILSLRYRGVRKRTEQLCAPLSVEDHVPQPMTDVSPPKWHLGHVTWFFEQFVLLPNLPGFAAFDPRYAYLFNSYYNAMGDRVARAERGHLSRPTVAEVLAYRAHVDAAMNQLLLQPLAADVAELIELGLQHEQQHQELLVTDIKYILGTQPLAPVYDPRGLGSWTWRRSTTAPALRWTTGSTWPPEPSRWGTADAVLPLTTSHRSTPCCWARHNFAGRWSRTRNTWPSWPMGLRAS